VSVPQVPPRLPDGSPEITLFRQLLTTHAGMVFGPSRRAFLEGRLKGRMEKAGARSLYEYYRMVAGPTGQRELQALVDEVSINETSFFRNPPHFDFLGSTVLPARLRARRDDASNAVRIWSAGCSTGQELYSIAMVFLETAVFHESWSLALVGTDISEKAIRQARTGAFDDRAIRDVPPERRLRFFEHRNGEYSVREWARRGVEFVCGNILDGPPWNDVDVIFCRNVMIYFDAASQKKLVDRLADSLAPGGYLFLGHTETLRGVSERFRSVSLRPGIAYRKDA
jgi:chemotaxis protein methyltransferase CheR